MTRRIIMAVTNDLLTDQRVDRSCKTLQEAGYSVTLIGRRLEKRAPLGARGYRCMRMRLLFRRSAWFYAEYNVRLFLKLLTMRADAFYSNDSDTLLACSWAARIRHKKLLFDAHELFPDVPELVGKPRVRGVWEWVERKSLPRVDAAFTVSQSVAEEYYKRYGITMAVVRNLPECLHCEVDPEKERELQEKARKREGEQYMILYQGAVNIGRGLRELVDVMGLLPLCRLVVAGDGDLMKELQAYTASQPWGERVVFLGRVEPALLRTLTPKADLGVCLLEELGKSYQYALPNRIGDYAQAEVPMVATGFKEISRILDEYEIGNTTDPCPTAKSGKEYEDYVSSLAQTLMETLILWGGMSAEERSRRFSRARKDLCWENEKKKLLNAVNTILL